MPVTVPLAWVKEVPDSGSLWLPTATRRIWVKEQHSAAIDVLCLALGSEGEWKTRLTGWMIKEQRLAPPWPATFVALDDPSLASLIGPLVPRDLLAVGKRVSRRTPYGTWRSCLGWGRGRQSTSRLEGGMRSRICRSPRRSSSTRAARGVAPCGLVRGARHPCRCTARGGSERPRR